MLTGTELAVWGDPIDHSLSPRLHGAAYGALGLDWNYGRRRVDAAGFDPALAGLDARWRGLSLTMPLKAAAAAAADRLDETARLTGAANTLLLGGGERFGVNTDVGGLVRALRAEGVDEVTTARILGAGATSTSALVALARLGARRIEIVARRLDALAPLAALGEALGVRVVGAPFDSAGFTPVAVTVSALAGGTDLGEPSARLADSGGFLLDVAYGSWPTPLALAWGRAGGEAASGHGMLLHQALLQVRVFVAGDASIPLPDEPLVLAVMSDVLVGD